MRETLTRLAPSAGGQVLSHTKLFWVHAQAAKKLCLPHVAQCLDKVSLKQSYTRWHYVFSRGHGVHKGEKQVQLAEPSCEAYHAGLRQSLLWYPPLQPIPRCIRLLFFGPSAGNERDAARDVHRLRGGSFGGMSTSQTAANGLLLNVLTYLTCRMTFSSGTLSFEDPRTRSSRLVAEHLCTHSSFITISLLHPRLFYIAEVMCFVAAGGHLPWQDLAASGIPLQTTFLYDADSKREVSDWYENMPIHLVPPPRTLATLMECTNSVDCVDGLHADSRSRRIGFPGKQLGKDKWLLVQCSQCAD